MIKPLISCLSLAVFWHSTCALAQAPKTPELITLDYRNLAAIRLELKEGQGREMLEPAYVKLLGNAENALGKSPSSVMDKEKVAPSGDKHDFFAIGYYSWPDPKSPNGLPYIGRDGQRNPEATGSQYDKGAYQSTISRINTLALAYYLSGEEKYATKAAELLRVWFLNPETRMNPNLNFAASRPGVQDGSYTGIIEGVVLIEMLDSVKLLTQSASWTAADNEALQKWFSDFSDWLVESAFGKQERAMINNHGVWYAAQVAAYALYANKPARVKEMLALGKQQIETQMTADGSLPAELKRTRSQMYSRYGMRAFSNLARCGDLVGEDLWHYKTQDGRGLELGFNFLAPYLGGRKEWPWPQISKAADYPASIQLIHWAAKAYQSEPIQQAARALNPIVNKELAHSFSPSERESLTIWLFSRNQE